ncbi:MAG: hypothetical protein IJ343_14905 [Clostridia bacterium]|nr:hypothetical protein [Clostridia bacterium]
MYECPNCGTELEKFNGRIGYCPAHAKWVSPEGLGYEDEAGEQNRLDEEAAEKRRLAEEIARQAELDRQHAEQQQRTIRMIVTVVTAICIVAAAVAFFIVRPAITYGNAADVFVRGEYEQALQAYEGLGGYQDAPARALLCQAMLDLEAGRTEDAVGRLEQLTAEGQGEMARQAGDALIPVIGAWTDVGLPPRTLLMLLDRADMIDPEGRLDVPALRLEAHTAMLEAVLSSRAADVDGDGAAELVALNADYTVTVYRMVNGGNTRIAVTDDVMADQATLFGDAYRDVDPAAALACYQEAYRRRPDDASRAALTAAYRSRAILNENDGDMTAAIADARSAMEVSGAQAEFNLFYEMNLRFCQNGRDTQSALALWEDFRKQEAAVFSRFDGMERWRADAAQMHIRCAGEMAALRDEGCMTELYSAWELGADVTEAAREAEAFFLPGLPLARLRLLELELFAADEAMVAQIRKDMTDEIRLAVGEWESRGVPAAEVPELIALADVNDVSLEGVDREGAWERAALAHAGAVTQSEFTNWDRDGYRELLTLESSGEMKLYGLNGSWQIVSHMDTKLPGGAFSIAGADDSLVLAVSAAKDELLVISGAGCRLEAVFRERGLSRFAASGMDVTFSRELAGSIVRYEDFAYCAESVISRPARTGVDWQQADYPAPAAAADALQRYFEARAYRIGDEQAVLTAQPDEGSLFTAEYLGALPDPDVPGTISAQAYLVQEDCTWFEVTYPSGSTTVRCWAEVAYCDGGWKVTGAADTYGSGMDAAAADFSLGLIALNEERTASLTSRGQRSTYRVLVPESGRMQLLWQSGEKAGSSDSHMLAMYAGTLTGEQILAYNLKPSLNRQQTKALFLSPGVYYVTVEAKSSKTAPYMLKVIYTPEEHVELEDNDVVANATPMLLNTPYAGVISDKKDQDIYCFTLTENTAVNVTLGGPGSGSKSANAYVCSVFSGTDGSSLATVSMTAAQQLTETGNLYLAPGPYLVQIKSGSTAVNDVYTLTVRTSQAGVMEAEANNTPETANAIPVNEDVHASIGQEGDVDCFSFTLTAPSVIQPRFTFRPTESNTKTYVLTILDGSRHELLKVNIGGKESTKTIVPVALQPGSYTVKVENPRFVRQDYTLHMVCQEVENVELEPNDTLALATKQEMGRVYTGVLVTEKDVDYYRIVFTETTQVTFDFSFAQHVTTSTAFNLVIEQNGKTLWSANLKGDSGGTSQQLQFPAGEYYIRVKPSSWLGTVYTIHIH